VFGGSSWSVGHPPSVGRQNEYQLSAYVKIVNADGECGWQQPAAVLIDHVGWLGLRAGGHLALSVQSSNKSSELSQWPPHDDTTINIDMGIIMAALWNRAGHYIFVLCFLLISSSFFLFLAYSQPSQIGCLSTSTHEVALVRI